MAISSKPTIQYQNRSISLPCRSHPNTAKVEEGLSKINSLEQQPPTANNITIAFFGFESLYSSMNELLKLKNTQKALSQGNCGVDELLDELMRLLDVCGTAKDFISQIKDHGRSIQSSIRRRKGDSDTQSSITHYISFRKRMSKEARKLVAVSKQIDYSRIKSWQPLDSDDHHLSSIVRSFRGVISQTFTILHYLLLFLSVPVSKPRSSSKWLLVSKLFHKGTVASHEDEVNNVNELQKVDTALSAVLGSDPSDGDKLQAALRSLQSLEVSTESIENGLEFLYRGMIKTRASLLNIAQFRKELILPSLLVFFSPRENK